MQAKSAASNPPRSGRLCEDEEKGVMKSWNEIRKAAKAFSRRWKDAYDEKSQAQSFLKEFFELFGVDVVIQKGLLTLLPDRRAQITATNRGRGFLALVEYGKIFA